VTGRHVSPGPSVRHQADHARRIWGSYRLASRVSIVVVAALLGILAVGQFRGQAGAPALAGLSATDLTQLIGNLTSGNDKLRSEITDLRDQAAHLSDAHDRGDTTVGELTSDLARIRAWAGLTLVSGQGIAITVQGPVGGDGVEDLINELRNAGAEAIEMGGIRLVPGVVAIGGPGKVTLDGQAVGDPVELDAIGPPDKLTGSLTRSGGLIAQLAATHPKVAVEVTPVDRLVIPATDRNLIPANGHPRL